MKQFLKKFRDTNESGIGLLEFALVLPVLALLVAGLIDYGQLIREMNTLSLVARDAARAASTHARVARNSSPGEVRVLCNNPSYPDTTIRCNDNPAALTIREYDAANAAATPDSIKNAAKKAACLGLQNARLDAGNFDVTSQIVEDPETPGNPSSYTAQEIRLHIQLKPDVRNCLLCWGNYLAGVPLQGDSVFVLEDRCR